MRQYNPPYASKFREIVSSLEKCEDVLLYRPDAEGESTIIRCINGSPSDESILLLGLGEFDLEYASSAIYNTLEDITMGKFSLYVGPLSSAEDIIEYYKKLFEEAAGSLELRRFIKDYLENIVSTKLYRLGELLKDEIIAVLDGIDELLSYYEDRLPPELYSRLESEIDKYRNEIEKLLKRVDKAVKLVEETWFEHSIESLFRAIEVFDEIYDKLSELKTSRTLNLVLHGKISELAEKLAKMIEKNKHPA